MKKSKLFKKKFNDFMFDHYYLQRTFTEVGGLLCGVLAAFLYAIGFVCFITPVLGDADIMGSLVNPSETFHIVTGGVSGLSQTIALIMEMIGVKLTATTLQAIGYTCFNVPLLIFAFLKIGKRFAIQSTINIVLSSIFLVLIPTWPFIREIATSPVLSYVSTGSGGETVYHSLIIVRVLFGAICIGLSSAIAFRADFSCGGIDIITYYVSMRKSTSVGKYSLLFNICITTFYSILLMIQGATNGVNKIGVSIVSVLISGVEIFTTSFIIDKIHLRNKKVQLEIITNNPNLGDVLVANFPHGATMSKGEGVYSNSQRIIIWMVVSSSETRKVVALAKRVDQHVFISVSALEQVHGKFFVKPIE